MTNSNPQSVPLSSDLQEILDNVHTMGMSDQLLGVKPHYYNKTLEKVAQALEALIQSRERAARIDELASLQRIAMFMSDVFGREQAMTSQISDRIATLSNNEGGNHERS